MSEVVVIEDQEHAVLYDLLLTKPERKFLADVRKGSRQMFGVGDIGLLAQDRAVDKGFPRYAALMIVGEEAGVGVRRMAKLCNVAERFPDKIREKFSFFPFSVFEEAIVFSPGEDVQMLEYARDQMSDTKRWTGAERIAGDFRKSILGLDTGHGQLPGPQAQSGGNGSGGGVKVTTSAHEYSIPPVSLDPKEWVSAADLRKLIGKWKGRGVTVGGCIKDIEKLIAG